MSRAATAWQRCTSVDLAALQGPQAQALMLLLAKYPEMLTRRRRRAMPRMT